MSGNRTLGLKWDQTLLRHKSNSEVVCLCLSKGKVPLPGCSSPSIPWGKSSCSQRLQKAAACSGTQGQLPQMPESCKQFAFHIQAPCRAGVGIPSIQKSANIPDTSGVVIFVVPAEIISFFCFPQNIYLIYLPTTNKKWSLNTRPLVQ